MRRLSNIILMILILVTNVSPLMAKMVMYNTKTGKYHNLSCVWALKCTVNCIKIDKEQAIKRGGIPCKVCGG